MSQPVRLIILTLMMPKGWCGVQTHFNTIADYANASGLQVSIVYPHQLNRWLRKLPGAIGRLLTRLNQESAVLVDRFFSRIFLKALLKKELSAAHERGESVVIYAQDALSARAALDLRAQGYLFRLVSVVHFNISEAQEFVEKGMSPQNGRLWRSLMANEKLVLPQLDQIIFVSAFMQQVVGARLPELSRVSQAVISNFPLAIDNVGGGNDLPSRDIIAIGTLESRKNQGFLLKILAECNVMGKRYTLSLVGDGPDRPALEHQANKLGTEQQVHFLGYQPNAATLISLHRVLIHPALMENLPITLLEGLRASKPLFAAPVGGIPEVFEDGEQGHYLDLDNPRDAALKLISVLENSEKWQRMSASAHETFTRRFHPDVLGPRWINALLGI